MRGRTLVLVALIAVALLPGPARAATKTVTAAGTAFTPADLSAAAHDTIRWEVTEGAHTIQGYQGAFYTSPVLTPGDVHTEQFPGGTVKYRCEIHSTLDPETEVCSGMCGTITGPPPAIEAPVITAPTAGQVIEYPQLWVRGTGPADAEQVRITEGQVILAYAPVVGGSWEIYLPFQNGTHTLRATSVDPAGFSSAPSAPVTFTVKIPDTRAPVILFTGPRNPVELNPLKISGRADDDVIVTSIQVEIRDILGGLRTPPTTCTGCGTPSGKFFAQAQVLPGRYTVTVLAYDAAGHVGSASRDVIMI